MENTLQSIYSIEVDKLTCPICHEIAFPPVKWFIQKPDNQHTPMCSHVYCLNCTRTYYQLNKKISDRNVNRYECLLCQQKLILGSTVTGAPKNASEVYFHCTTDECRIVKLLVTMETDSLGRKCVEDSCNYRTCCPEEMKSHCRNECEVALLKCTFQGCHFMSTRKFMKEHEIDCRWKPIRCKFCSFQKCHAELLYHYTQYHRIETNTDTLI